MNVGDERIVIAWEGAPPSEALAARLRPIFRVEAKDAHARACVVATEAAPRVPPDLPWIWAPRRLVSSEEIAACVTEGAYDVVPQPAVDGAPGGAAPDAAERLFVRLVELARDEELPPLPPDVVSSSAAAQSVLRQLARA